MKSLLIFCASMLVSLSSFAGSFYGETVTAPAVVKVITEKGELKEYAITNLKAASIDEEYQMIQMSENGLISRCADYLGDLAEDFTVTVQSQEGLKTGTISASSGQEAKVAVFGMCHKGSNELSQLQIDVKSGNGFQVK